MKKTIMIKKAVLTCYVLLLILVNPLGVYAEAINLEISGNGDGSESSIETNVEQEVTVEQSNEAEINNNVSVEANTGDNSANNNTSEQVSVETGDASVTEEISNEVNHNQLDLESCCQETQITQTIINNGSGSKNSINSDITNESNYTQSNQVKINNTITTHANTGNNHASNNTGSTISINTGNINHRSTIQNKANTSVITAANSKPGSIVVTIKNNGTGSHNDISVAYGNTTTTNVINLAKISNENRTYLNTGNNKVSGNTAASISIETGDIDSIINIINDPINSSIIHIGGCCGDPSDPSDPSDPEDPSDPSDPGDPGDPGDDSDDSNDDDSSDKALGGASSDNSSSGSDSNGEVLGAILPATGFDTTNLLIFNALMFISGLTLRFRLWEVFEKDYSLTLTISY